MITACQFSVLLVCSRCLASQVVLSAHFLNDFVSFVQTEAGEWSQRWRGDIARRERSKVSSSLGHCLLYLVLCSLYLAALHIDLLYLYLYLYSVQASVLLYV